MRGCLILTDSCAGSDATAAKRKMQAIQVPMVATPETMEVKWKSFQTKKSYGNWMLGPANFRVNAIKLNGIAVFHLNSNCFCVALTFLRHN